MENRVKKQTLLLVLFILGLAGCATSTSYDSYTYQRFPPKDPLSIVNVYSESQALGAGSPYYVIGKVSVEGFAGDGINPGSLTNQAKVIARKKGADAIINAKIEEYHYYYGEALLRFKGELIVYASAASRS